MNPTAHRLAVLAIQAVAAVLTVVIVGIMMAAVDGPLRWLVDYSSSYGIGGSVAFLVAIPLSGYLLMRYGQRRERQAEAAEVARTGVLHVEKPPPEIDMRRAVKRVLLIASPLYLAAFVMFCICVYVVIRGPG